MNEAIELAIVLAAKDMASETLEHVGGKLEGLGSAGKIALAGIAAVATSAITIGTTLFELGNKAEGAALEVRKLSRETGFSAEQASELRYAGERLNISTDDLSKTLGKFSKGLEASHPALEKYHIAVVKTKDGHIDMAATLGNVADRFASMPDGVEKTAISMDLFGKTGKDMIPLLNEGSKGLAAQGEEAKKLGLVFSKDATDAAFKFQQAQKDLQDRFEGITNKIGVALLPVLANLFGMLTDAADVIIPPLVEVFGKVWTILTEVFDVITGRAPDAGAAMTDALGPDAARAIMGAVAGIRDMISAVIDVLGQFINWLGSSDDAATAIRATLKFLGDVIGTLWRIELKGLGLAFEAIGTLIRNIGPAFETMGMIVAIVKDKFREFTKIGEDLVSGLWQGIVNAWDGLMANFRGLIDKIPEGVRKFLGISSPSTVFAEIGQNMVAGLAQGIIDAGPIAIGAMRQVATATQAAGSWGTLPVGWTPQPAGPADRVEEIDRQMLDKLNFELATERQHFGTNDLYHAEAGLKADIHTHIELNGKEIATAVSKDVYQGLRLANGTA